MVEQRIRNAKVEGSIPFTGTTLALHAPRCCRCEISEPFEGPSSCLISVESYSLPLTPTQLPLFFAPLPGGGGLLLYPESLLVRFGTFLRG